MLPMQSVQQNWNSILNAESTRWLVTAIMIVVLAVVAATMTVTAAATPTVPPYRPSVRLSVQGSDKLHSFFTSIDSHPHWHQQSNCSHWLHTQLQLFCYCIPTTGQILSTVLYWTVIEGRNKKRKIKAQNPVKITETWSKIFFPFFFSNLRIQVQNWNRWRMRKIKNCLFYN